MTLLGGNEHTQNSYAYKEFINLINDSNEVVTKLNKVGIAVQIKLLFAYPYSDFYYDLIQAEAADHIGCSIACIIKKKNFTPTIDGPQILDNGAVSHSNTYLNLEQSLLTLNEESRRSNIYSEKLDIQNNINKNQLNVKFTPVHGLCCFLQINNTIFMDSYLYAKEKSTTRKISLISPIIKIEGQRIGNVLQLPKKEQEIINGNFNQKHYYSALSHFRYLWEHDLSLYLDDVCVIKQQKIKIKEPRLISYRKKAERLAKKYHFTPVETDLWKQKVKDEFKKYTSKFPEQPQTKLDRITLFIVGSWKDKQANEYMKKLEDLMLDLPTKKYSLSENNNGLKVKPVIFEVGDGEFFQQRLFDSLSTCHAACVIQTDDIFQRNDDGTTEFYSRPNVYLEKGYLLHHLGKYTNYKGELTEKVFTFIKENVNVESDNINTGRREFLDINDFKYQFFRIIFLLWETTELNNECALKLMENQRQILTKAIQKLSKYPTKKNRMLSHLKHLDEYIVEIKRHMSI
jgi:hypothetical protein